MAKGKIAKLINPWGNYTWTRLGKTLELVQVELDRGEGKYLGLAADTELDILEDITSKSEEVQKDPAIRGAQFIAKINGMFNSAIFRPLWRESVEKYPLGTELTEEQKTAVLSSFAEKLDAWFKETTTREKGSAYYYKQAAEKAKEVAKARDAALAVKDKPEEYAKLKAAHAILKAEYDELVAKGKEKEAEEQAGLLDDLDLD